MYLRTGPGPGEAGKKHFYYVDIYFCNTHGARLLHESGSKPSALQPGHNKNITVHSTQHTQHGTQIAELSFPALSHRHRPAVSTRPTPRALSTRPHTKTQARATRPDTGAYAQKGRAATGQAGEQPNKRAPPGSPQGEPGGTHADAINNGLDPSGTHPNVFNNGLETGGAHPDAINNGLETGGTHPDVINIRLETSGGHPNVERARPEAERHAASPQQKQHGVQHEPHTTTHNLQSFPFRASPTGTDLASPRPAHHKRFPHRQNKNVNSEQ